MEKEQEERLKQKFYDIVDHLSESDLDVILELIRQQKKSKEGETTGYQPGA